MSLSPGTRFGPYEILAPLGAGGMGEVWRARDTMLGRDVAIKTLPAALAADVQYIARFEREAQVLASLNHPNIAAIYGLQQNSIVMELVEGATLAERIPAGGIPWTDMLPILTQIAEGLEAAHDRGIVHRDLKPANIKITPSGAVKLLDFGLAKNSGESAAASATISPTLSLAMTQAGVILGTAGYMSPEQARGQAVDKRTDIWSFGAIVWEMATGTCLFEGKTIADTLAHVLTREPDLTLAPAAAQRLLSSCLAKDPKHRLRSIGDWRLLADAPADEASRSAKRKQGRLGWAVAALASAIAAVAVWGWSRPADAPDPPAYNLVVLPPEGESLHPDASSGFQAISPDGHTLAFITSSNGARRIWIRPLDSQVARAVAGTGLADGLFWSPDSRHLGFTAGNKLERIDIATGAVKEICDGGSTIRGAAWSSDGTILFGSTASAIQRVSADGGTPVAVTHYVEQTDTNHNYPQFLPDGKRYLYWVRGAQNAATGIYAGSLDRPFDQQQHKLILSTSGNAVFVSVPGQSKGHLLFLRGRTLFAQPFDSERLSLSATPRPVAENVGARGAWGQYSVSQTGLLTTSAAGNSFRTVTALSRNGQEISTVGQPDAYSSMLLSPDGKTLAVVKAHSDSTLHIWLMDMANGTAVRFTENGTLNVYPTWSADGHQLLYSSSRGARYQLYRKPIGGVEQVIPAPENALSSNWLVNPERLVYVSRGRMPAEPLWSIRMLPLEEGKDSLTLVEPSKSATYAASVSPSQQWLAYTAAESGTPDVYVRSMPSATARPGPPVRISTGGGENPAWSADGKELFFSTPDNRLMSTRISIHGDRIERQEPQFLFALNGTSLFNGAIYWQPIGNGDRFLVLRSTPVAPRDNVITLIMNWQRLLR